MSDDLKIINNDNKNGQTKCPNCGASNLHYDIDKEKLICNYCLKEYSKEEIEDKEEVNNLKGEVRGSATKDIDNNSSSLVTIKCDGCGAEIVLNSKEEINAKCHWCGSMLSINKQVDNGVIPDEILPFKITKEEALTRINNYVSKKLKYTTKDFKNGLNLSNIRGVFFPYLLFDGKGHGIFSGVGEIRTRSYSVGDDTYYDADVYNIEREFDIVVDDLTIESSLERLDKYNIKQKNSVINAILPFDTENCIKFNANYLDNYTSEKRDIDISNIEDKVHAEVMDIARYKINETIKNYNRGVRWDKEEINYEGKQWLSAYLPVWLYSYQDKKHVIHYVAVNGRTGEVVGSIPFDRGKLFLTLLFIILISIVLGLLSAFIFIPLFFVFLFIGLLTSLIIFIVEDYKYSNLYWIRHSYELETKCNIDYTNYLDDKVDTIKRTSFPQVKDANNKKINGEFTNIKKDTK